MPGWALFRRVNRDRVPFYAVIAVSVVRADHHDPGAVRSNDVRVPWAFFALTGICTVGLYIAYIIPVYLRLRAGDAFEPGPWTLGRSTSWSTSLAIIFVIVVVIRCSPAVHARGVPWNDDFDVSLVNYTPLVDPGSADLRRLVPGLARRTGTQGPVRTLEEDEVTAD